MLKVSLKILLTLILSICSIAIFAQTSNPLPKTSHFNLYTFTGRVIPHDDTLKPLTGSTIRGIRTYVALLNFYSPSTRNQGSIPSLGFSTLFIDLGDNKRLGKVYGFQPSLMYDINNNGRLKVDINAGLGAAFLTKKYSKDINPDNVAISTHLNYWATLSINTTIKVNKHLYAGLGIETHHFSNGAIHKPNYGLNLVATSLSFRYYIEAFSLKTIAYETECNQPHTGSLLLTIGSGIKETGGAGGPKYYPVSIAIQSGIWEKEFLSAGIGIDLTHDKSIRFHRNIKKLNYSSPNDDIQTGIFFTGSFIFNRISLYSLLGIYLYNPNPRLPPCYQKIGVRYNLFGNLTVHAELKTHLNVADHVELGLGIRI